MVKDLELQVGEKYFTKNFKTFFYSLLTHYFLRHTLEKMVKLLTVHNMAGSSFTAEAAAAAAAVVVLL